MTPRFLKFCDSFVLDWECDWPRQTDGDPSDDPDDPGGYTRWGIDASSHPSVNVRDLTHAQALVIYFGEWTREGIESMPDKLGEAFFDSCVNCGFPRARTFLEKSNTAGGLISARENFYRRLVKSRPKFKKYLRGWLNRTTYGDDDRPSLRHFLLV